MRSFLLVALWLCLASGCDCGTEGGAMANSYYLDPHKDLRRIGRVALLELETVPNYPDVSANLSEALFLAIQKEQLFGLTIVPRDHEEWADLQDGTDYSQMLRQLASLRGELECNGVLFGAVTEYRPYPHMAIGLRLKLLDLTDGQVLWGLEQVWDAGDRSIQKRVKDYIKQEVRSSSTPLQEEMVVVSPLSFAKFASYEVAQTMVRESRR